MKIWIKLLIGSILGITLGFRLPENQRLNEILVWLEQFVIRIGRYALIPVLVFSLTIAVFELLQDKRFWSLIFRNLLIIAVISFLVIFAGVLATNFFPPARIPILIEEQMEAAKFDVAGYITAIFPFNSLSVLAGDGVYLFPICVFAFFFGLGLSYERNYSKTIVTIIDSLSRIFYQVAIFFIEILGFVIIVLSCYWTIRFREIIQAEIFFDLIVLLGVLAAVLSFGILPLILLLFKPKKNPWAVLYGSLGPAIAAFFSGDINLTLPVMMRHFKESLGIRRRCAMVNLAMFGTFSRAGSAMVAAVAFIVIIKSYSPLEITTAEIMNICIRAFIISFLLAGHPGSGAFVALTVLCFGYGKGFEAGFLILKPLTFFMITIGAFLDVMIASFASYASAQMGGYIEEKDTKQRFI